MKRIAYDHAADWEQDAALSSEIMVRARRRSHWSPFYHFVGALLARSEHCSRNQFGVLTLK